MVLVHKWPFLQLFFLGNLEQENVFYDILERKNAFVRYKHKKSKKPKNWHFSKGVNPWFWSKNGQSSIFLKQFRPGKWVFYDILEEKTPFYAIKTKSSKTRKIDIFPMGLTMVLVQKWPFFQLFLKIFTPGKCLFWYSRTKRSLFTL